jgi:glutamine cyclotransferase
MTRRFLFYIIISGVLFSCGGKNSTTEKTQSTNKATPPPYEVRMVVEHDPNAYTQGLVFHNDKIIEGTGGSDSWIAEFDINTAQYDRKVTLGKEYFGEGITVLNNKIFQLTWQSKKGFIYDVHSFKKIGEFSYQYEGWGITHDNSHLIISDGTDKLHYLDTLTLTEVFTKSIHDKNQTVPKLNELEFIEGFIFANQYETNFILKIDPNTSQVVDKFNLGNLESEIKRLNPAADVLNGIAYNKKTGDVLITGKYWPRSYLVRFRESH